MPYISVWVLIPSILMGGEVIADALVSGTLGIDAGAGTGVGAAQAQLRMPNSNIRGISISGTIDFIFIFWNNGIVNA